MRGFPVGLLDLCPCPAVLKNRIMSASGERFPSWTFNDTSGIKKAFRKLACVACARHSIPLGMTARDVVNVSLAGEHLQLRIGAFDGN